MGDRAERPAHREAPRRSECGRYRLGALRELVCPTLEEIRARYDDELRFDPPPEEGVASERIGPVVRTTGRYALLTSAPMEATEAAGRVAEQAAFFRARAVEVEWKLFGHDRPAVLADLLRAEGFEPDEPETLMVFELAAALPTAPAHAPLSVREVHDTDGLADAVRASDEAFARGDTRMAAELRRRLTDPTMALYVAYWDGLPVAAGRLEMPAGRSFAGLYGGGTVPAFRGRGIYRHLVAARAERARQRGYAYLTVDARESSRGILERLGFRPLTTVQGWILKPNPASGRSSG